MPVTGPHPGHGHRPAIHSYDLHGIVRVASAVPLGDLQRFEVDECRAQPDLRLVIGRPARGEPRLGTLHGHPGATIAFSGVRVTAWMRRPQAWAPSLLYPSVVEPLLQRLFFDRGMRWSTRPV